MKRIILLITILIAFTINAQERDKGRIPFSNLELIMSDWGGDLYASTNVELYGLNNVALRVLSGRYVLGHTGAQVEAVLDKVDSLTLPMSSLNVFDDGLTTQILVGGGLNTVPVWGTDLPTGVTIGSAYIYRVGGTDVVDEDVADNITITNISQVGDITATATEINYTTDVTSNIQAQIDLKAPLASPAFTGVPVIDSLSTGNFLITEISNNNLSIYNTSGDDADDFIESIDSIGSRILGDGVNEPIIRFKGPNYATAIQNGQIKIYKTPAGTGVSTSVGGSINGYVYGIADADDVRRFQFDAATGTNNYIMNSLNYYADTSGTNGNVNALGVNTTEGGAVELPDGTVLQIKCNSTNTGAVTLRFNAGTSGAIVKTGTTDLAAGDLAPNWRIFVSYDATNNRFQLISPVAQ